MAVLMGTEVVETVGECQYLRIGELFAQLLNTSVYVTAVNVNLSYLLTVESQAETQHSVCRRVLRTDVYYVLVAKNLVCLLFSLAFSGRVKLSRLCNGYYLDM